MSDTKSATRKALIEVLMPSPDPDSGSGGGSGGGGSGLPVQPLIEIIVEYAIVMHVVTVCGNGASNYDDKESDPLKSALNALGCILHYTDKESGQLTFIFAASADVRNSVLPLFLSAYFGCALIV